MTVDTFQRAVSFSVPPWPEDNVERWAGLAERAAAQAHGRGESGGRFADLVAQVRGLLAQGAFDVVGDRIVEQRFLRALLTVWAGDDVAWMSMPALFPAAQARLLERPSRRTGMILAELYWKVFDRLDAAGKGLFTDVGGTLYDVARRLADDGETGGPLGAVAQSPHQWLTVQAPGSLARHLVSEGRSMDDHLRATGVYGMEGRFGVLARRAYYLEEIARADHTADGHPFLDDVTRAAVTAAETEDDLSFGHALLSALCDKPVDRDPSAQWLDAVVGIGGDPRLRETAEWRRWWSAVPAELTARACRWMVGADLQVYFDALDDYAQHYGSVEMQRMLPARTRFLRGLYRSGLVREVRLVLGDEVRRVLSRRATSARVDAARYTGPNATTTAVVVLVCDGFTVVEGSHNFSLYLYAGEPVPLLVDPRKRSYALSDFKDVVPAQHESTYGTGLQVRFRHNEIWQPKALHFLRAIGVAVDPRAVYSAEDYEQQRRRELYGSGYSTASQNGGRSW